MARSIIWNIKNNCIEGVFPTTGDANTALRKHLSKCGTLGGKKDAAASADYEVITVT